MLRSNEKISRSAPKYCSARMNGVVNKMICTTLVRIQTEHIRHIVTHLNVDVRDVLCLDGGLLA
jgi:hypothetical protein